MRSVRGKERKKEAGQARPDVGELVDVLVLEVDVDDVVDGVGELVAELVLDAEGDKVADGLGDVRTVPTIGRRWLPQSHVGVQITNAPQDPSTVKVAR